MKLLKEFCKWLQITPFLPKLKMDIISDLHIDHWSSIYNKKYPFGTIKEFPFRFNPTLNSSFLIIAGDICDNIEDSVNFLHYASHFYEKILFVDGNHEHTHKYPYLYTKQNISNMIDNKKVIYLSQQSYVIQDVAFVGSSGWWNYNNADPDTISKCTTYFNSWIPQFGKKENMEFIDNVLVRAKEDYEYLNTTIAKFEEDPIINKIVVVTHTVPKPELCSNFTFKCNSTATQHNSDFQEFNKYKKISHWIYGHSHTNNDYYENEIRYINNARGRPDDYDRTSYQVKTIEI